MSENKKWAPLCVWCSAPWSDGNIKVENDLCACDSGGVYKNNVYVCIVCHSCGKEMYRKEFNLMDD